jgi:two-component system response regulator YesN
LFDNNAQAVDLASSLNHSFFTSSAGRQDLLFGFCLEFYMQLKRNLTELGENADGIIPDTVSATGTIRDCTTPGALFQWLSDLILAACTHVQEKRKIREYDVIQEAKRYIQNNLSEDLTLNRVSSKVYMSPAYFSTVFKIKTGVNFSDYLTKVRMEAAVHYMSDRTRKTYEIAESLGYKNPRYFSDVFRKYYGMTPSAFRDKIDQEP